MIANKTINLALPILNSRNVEEGRTASLLFAKCWPTKWNSESTIDSDCRAVFAFWNCNSFSKRRLASEKAHERGTDRFLCAWAIPSQQLANTRRATLKSASPPKDNIYPLRSNQEINYSPLVCTWPLKRIIKQVANIASLIFHTRKTTVKLFLYIHS